MDLTEILEALRGWLQVIAVPARILTDRSDALRVIFETDAALGELIAGDGEYAPYRFVSFTVLDARPEPYAEPVFSFCDDGSHTLGDILRELNQGLAFFGE